MKAYWAQSLIVLASVALVLVVLILVGAKVRSASAAPRAPEAPDPYKVNGDMMELSPESAIRAGISEAKIEAKTVPMTLTLTCRSGLNLETVTHVRAQFGGKVGNIGPGLGDFVKGPGTPGGATVLCTIESNDLAAAKNSYLQIKIQTRQDEDTYDRTKELVQAKVLAEKFLIEALSTLVKDRAALEASRQQLLIFGLNQHEIDEVQNEVGRQRMDYIITSPRTGVIAEKGVAGGEVADPSLNLFTIADTSTMWVWGDVYERDLRKISVGQSMKIYFASEPDRPRECKIDWISPVLDPNTHTVKIRGMLDNPDGRILSDMYGTLIVTVDDGKDSITVPADAVVRQGVDSFAFVRAGSTSGTVRYRRTAVTIAPFEMGFGASEGASVATARSTLRIVKGISTGDTVVTRGTLGLFNEMTHQQANGQ